MSDWYYENQNLAFEYGFWIFVLAVTVVVLASRWFKERGALRVWLGTKHFARRASSESPTHPRS